MGCIDAVCVLVPEPMSQRTSRVIPSTATQVCFVRLVTVSGYWIMLKSVPVFELTTNDVLYHWQPCSAVPPSNVETPVKTQRMLRTKSMVSHTSVGKPPSNSDRIPNDSKMLVWGLTNLKIGGCDQNKFIRAAWRSPGFVTMSEFLSDTVQQITIIIQTITLVKGSSWTKKAGNWTAQT